MKGMLALAALLGVLSVCRVQVRIHCSLFPRTRSSFRFVSAGTALYITYRRGSPRSLSCGALTLEIRQMSGAAKRTTAIDVSVCGRFFEEKLWFFFSSSPKLSADAYPLRFRPWRLSNAARSMTAMPHTQRLYSGCDRLLFDLEC